MLKFPRICVSWLLLGGLIYLADDRVSGADKQTQSTDKLPVDYAEMLRQLHSDISKELPPIDAKKQAALEKARAAVQAATVELTKTQQNLQKVASAYGLIDHAKVKWIGGAEKEIAKAQLALKNAKNDTERTKANQDIAKWQANKEDGQKALQQRQESLEKIKLEEPQFRKAHKAAEESLAKAKSEESAALRGLLADAKLVLASDKLDEKLMKAVVLTSATPAGLSQFVKNDKLRQGMLQDFLANPTLMKEMLVAGGPAKGKFGEALQIYTNIRKASERSRDGLFHRLAVAVSLAHAEPIAQRNFDSESASPAFVDPVQRYLHYEKAYLAGELDPASPNLTTWEYRYVVDSYATDAMLTWVREMLRNYRPDHILNPDYGWRYSGAVRTDVAYRHSNEYQDSPDLTFFQNVCKNGGICGRRAFFGRYIVQAFGLPARPFTQPKHAALVRWTPNGWVVNLGAGWPVGWFPEQRGPEFLAETQARQFPQDYLQVLRAEWIDTIVKPPVVNKKGPVVPTIWNQLADHVQKGIIEGAKAKPAAVLGANLAEATESKETRAAAVAATVLTDADKKITFTSQGEIRIPAGALSGGNHLVKSFSGGQQAIAAKAMTVTIDVPTAGKYKLQAEVVTVHGEEKMAVTVNGKPTASPMVIPFTIGKWEKTLEQEVTLVAGKNTLKFDPPAQSFALKGFQLVPVK